MSSNENVESLLTNIDDILAETNSYIDNFNSAINSMTETVIDFITQYDDYTYNTIYDASYLKERMKDTVIKAVTNELQ